MLWTITPISNCTLVLLISSKAASVNIIPAFIRRRIAHRANLGRIIDNIGWLFFDKALRMGVGLFVGVWVARYLGPEQFGQLSFATAFIGLFGAIAGLGLQGIVVRDIIRDPACKEEILGTTAALQMMGGLIAYAITVGTIFWLRPDDNLIKALVAILGSSMLLRASDITIYWFESQLQSKYIVWVQNIVIIFFAVIKVVLILSNAELILFAWAIATEALVITLALIAVMSKHGPPMRKFSIRIERAKQLLKAGWPLMLSGLAVLIYMRIDQIMLGQMIGDKAVGIFGSAARISEVWYFIPTAICASLLPTILEAKKRSEKQYYERLQKLYDLMVVLSVTLALPMTFLAPYIITFLYGEAYRDAGVVLAIHIWSGVFVFLGVARGSWTLAENMQHLDLIFIAVASFINIVGNYYFIPQYGPIGAACVTVFSQFCSVQLLPFLNNRSRKVAIMGFKSMNLIAIYSRHKNTKLI